MNIDDIYLHYEETGDYRYEIDYNGVRYLGTIEITELGYPRFKVHTEDTELVDILESLETWMIW